RAPGPGGTARRGGQGAAGRAAGGARGGLRAGRARAESPRHIRDILRRAGDPGQKSVVHVF
ncbi:hypothetical protein, partial [Micromonospora arborensis]|uniref:hypothetical protein n=1 Tax=Micromonospora arborensis TaxID=2116518 RepID=UPI001ABFD8CB